MKRLYVESNFVLELAFAQEQSTYCEELLEAAEHSQIELVVPAFCLAEPLETLVRRHRDRTNLYDRLLGEIKQLRRNAAYADALTEAERVTDLLGASADDDDRRLEESYLRVVETAAVIVLTPDVVRSSFDLRREFALPAQDATILASIVDHLGRNPSPAAFVTRNTKDFDDPEIRAHLGDRNCDLLTAFGEAVGYARHDRN